MLRLHVQRPPDLVDYQLTGMYGPARNLVWEATTKSGKTVSGVGWQMEHWACYRNGVEFREPWRRGLRAAGNHVWFAPSIKQAKIAYRRAKKSVRPWIEAGVVKSNDSDRSLVILEGGIETSRWEFWTTDNLDALYGDEVDSAVIDEASRHRAAADDAIQTLCTKKRAPRRYIGNVKDKVNWQWKLARAVQAADPPFDRDWMWLKTTIWDACDAGIHDRSEIEQIRATMAAKGALHIFRRDYEADPEGTNMAFPSDVLERCQDAPSVPKGRNVLLVDPGGVSDPCGIVVCRVDPRGDEYTAEVIHAERWWGPSHRLEALVAEHVKRWSPAGIALDRAHDSLVSACKANWGKRVHVVSRQHMWDSYGVVRSMAHSGSLRIPPAMTELLDDLGNVAVDGEQLVVPHYDITRYVDGAERTAQSHCDLAEALIRMGAVLGTIGRQTTRIAPGATGGYTPPSPDPVRSIFG